MNDPTLFAPPAPATTEPRNVGRPPKTTPNPPCSVDGCDVRSTKRGMCEPHYQGERRAKLGSCSVEGCDTHAQVTGLCLRHYHRKRRWGTTDDPEPTPALGACSVEGCDDTVKSRGMCLKHYARDQRSKYGNCTIDGCDNGASSRHGLCAKHYQRKLMHGTTDEPAPRRKMATTCSVADCGKPTRARGYCPAHWSMWKKYGSPEPPPKREFYCRACQKWFPMEFQLSTEGNICKDCGRRHQRERRQYRAQRVYRTSIADQMERQGGRCAICGIAQEDSTRNLSVDHDHVTGKMRGMLCGECNLGIGKLRDDPHLVEIAAIYLRTH